MDFLPDIEKFKNFFDGTDSKNEISIAVEEAKKYDIFNLISRVSALNLFHQNQTKSVILDTYIEGVLCQTRDQFPSKYTISSGKFRKIINQISDTSLKYSIDPPENMFVQNIMFYGNYRVLNGIDQTPAYNLQHMISVLFAKGIEYPKEFLDATYILVNGMLEISEKIVGGILNTENNHDTDEEKGIMIPSAMELNKYTELVITNGADFRKLFLNRIELLDLVTIEFGVQFEGDFDNKSFYTRPFLYNEEKDQYILLNAGLLPTAIVFWITCLAKKYGIFEEVLENYNDYIFHECQKYLCNLGHKKVLESQMGIDLFSSSGYKEYIASVQNNQLVIVQYLYDDGKNYNACTLHSTIEKKEFNDVVSKYYMTIWKKFYLNLCYRKKGMQKISLVILKRNKKYLNRQTEIRRFKEEDAKEVRNLIVRNFLEVNSKDYGISAMEKLAKVYDVEKVLNVASYVHMYVFEFDGKIIGTGSISSFWGSETESILLSIFVLPEFHGKGVGRKIINTLETDEFYVRASRIEIPASITATEFYRKFGYDYKNGVKELDNEHHYRLEKFKEAGLK